MGELVRVHFDLMVGRENQGVQPLLERLALTEGLAVSVGLWEETDPALVTEAVKQLAAVSPGVPDVWIRWSHSDSFNLMQGQRNIAIVIWEEQLGYIRHLKAYESLDGLLVGRETSIKFFQEKGINKAWAVLNYTGVLELLATVTGRQFRLVGPDVYEAPKPYRADAVGTVVIGSIADWWTMGGANSPRWYAREFAKRGWQVVYIQPGPVGEQPPELGITALSASELCGTQRVVQAWTERYPMPDEAVEMLIEVASGCPPPHLLMVFWAARLLRPLMEAWRSKGWPLTYHVIDDIPALDPLFREDENDYADMADVAFTTSRHYEQRFRRNLVLCPNAYSPEAFPVVRDRASRGAVVGYWGHMWGAHFSWRLVLDACDAHPEWLFVMVGGASDRARGIARPNLRIDPVVPYSELPSVARTWDVGTIPFVGSISHGLSPLKVFEYLACGLPVVTGDIMEPVRGYPYVYQGDSSGPTFVRLIEGALDQRPDMEIVGDFLEAHSWRKRVDLILQTLGLA